MKTGNLLLTAIVTVIILTACKTRMDNKIITNYPETKKEVVRDTFFGTIVEDPYRWLEDDMSDETAEWVKQQNQTTFNNLSQIPFRNEVRRLFDKLYSFTKYYLPKKGGKYYYYLAKDSGKNQPVLYRSNLENDNVEEYLDPNMFSADGSVSLENFEFSKSGKYMACDISESGSDWRTIKFYDCDKRSFIEDKLENAKFTDLTWFKDEGLYYSSYDFPSEGSLNSAVTRYHKLYYHKLGTRQEEDIIIYGNKKNQLRRYISAWITDNQKYLVINLAQTTSGSEIYLKDLQDKKSTLIPVVNSDQFENNVIHISNDKIFLWTTMNAPNGKLISLDLSNPQLKNGINIIPESKDVIEDVVFIGGYFIVQYLRDAAAYLVQYNINGSFVREPEIPGRGTILGFSGGEEDTFTFYRYQSFTEYPSIYKLSLSDGQSEIFKSPESEFDKDGFVTKQIFYKSKDGTRIPMFLVYRKGLNINKNTPTLLYGYGGFNISETPEFDIRWITWLEMGGLLAKPNLRGGGEYGEKWHQAGIKLNKQNVFDDFIAAAEYLQENNYTSKEKLTVMGRSNGGLLIGAVITQKPNLMQVALPVVGVMDMLRYHKFTAGAGWVYDFGSAESDKEMFEYLYVYSPVHNVKAGVQYPATMIATGDHDDRVVPAHSFKFAAELQDKQSGDKPVLIRIDTETGHGGTGKHSTKYLDEIADLYSFAFFNMNVQPVLE